jgi:hypothetical protein
MNERQAALEEAAVKCEEVSEKFQRKYSRTGNPAYGGAITSALDCAAAIRNMIYVEEFISEEHKDASDKVFLRFQILCMAIAFGFATSSVILIFSGSFYNAFISSFCALMSVMTSAPKA